VLGQQYGIVFTARWLAHAAQRFGSALVTKGEFDGYSQPIAAERISTPTSMA